MKKTIKLLTFILVLVALFGVLSVNANAAVKYGYMIPVDNKFTKQVSTVYLYGKKDYINFAIDCYTNNVCYAVGIFKDEECTDIVAEDKIICDKGSYTYTPCISLSEFKTGTYYGIVFAGKIKSNGSFVPDYGSAVGFTVKVDKTTAFDKQVVQLKTAKNTVNGPEVKWNKLSGAAKYKVYRRSATSSKWTLVGTTTSTSFTDKKMRTKSGAYVYSVKGINKKGVSSRYQYMGIQTAVVGAPKITSLKVSGNNHTLKWESISGVKTYYVYRKKGNGSYSKLAKVTNGKTTYTDKTTKTTGSKYTYTVKAEREIFGQKVVGAYHKSGKSIYYVQAPLMKSATVDTNNRVIVKWDKVKGATYDIYRKEANGDWSVVKKGHKLTTFYDDTEKNSGKKYVYTVRAVVDGKRSHYISGKSFLFVGAPNITEIKAGENGAVIKWAKVSGAKKYRILTKPASATKKTPWTEIDVVGNVASFEDTTNGLYGARIYTVQSIGDSKVNGSYSAKGVEYLNIPVIEGAIVDTETDKSIKFTWPSDYNDVVDGYNVYRKLTVFGEWELVAEKINGNEYCDTDVEYDISYSYVVVCVIGKAEGTINDELAKSAEPYKVIDYAGIYNNLINNAKENALTVTKVKEGSVNYKGLVNAGAFSDTAADLMSIYLVDSYDDIEVVNETQLKEELPPANVIAALDKANILESDYTEDVDYAYITITAVDAVNSVAGDSGVGSLCNPITEDDVLNATADITSLQLSNMNFAYENVNVICKIEKSTGNLVNIKIDVPCILSVKASMVTGITVEADIGIETFSEYDITYEDVTEEVNPIEENPLLAYQNACRDIAENGTAGYTKKVWQSITKPLETDNAFLSSSLNDFMEGYITVEQNAADVVMEKGSDEAKQNMPLSNCDEDDVLAATAEKSGENYIVSILMKAQANPSNEGASAICAMTDSIFYIEDISSIAAENGAQGDQITYTGYVITALMSADGKLIEISHYGEGNYTMNMSMPTGDVVCSGSIGFNAKYSNFVY